MAVKIKLKRMGKIRTPQYRIIIADARNKRDGKAIEEIGKYHPKEEPSFIEVNSERAQYWLSVGAQPTVPVQKILRLTGDWQKFKGLPAPPPLKVAEPRDKEAEEAAFQAVLKELVLPDNESKGKAKKSDKADSKAEQAEQAAASDSEPAEAAAEKSEGEA
ncbi:30S ribosomal protein S16 [Salinactinospora qingdaonensis]|uniref:Small ribosomal subunit protein bS16 n=1 Tax=Salinactinospora qingdaonensis TaxID=702744 RepID=A0ABP7FS22_9ACTN